MAENRFEIAEDRIPIPGEGLRLFRDEQGLALEGEGMVLRGDFEQMIPRLKPHTLQRELLVRACRIKGAGRPAHLLDATAGLGEDSLLLASAGYRITLYESDPVIAALLRDALRRGREHPALREAVGRMELVEGDSLEAMKRLREPVSGQDPPEVIYLDPMFPERRKSGLVKKKFQLLQKLELPCGNEEELLEAALGARPLRIVIKRPLKGPSLAGVSPTFTLRGKAIRYDCITP